MPPHSMGMPGGASSGVTGGVPQCRMLMRMRQMLQPKMATVRWASGPPSPSAGEAHNRKSRKACRALVLVMAPSGPLSAL